jgi:hypothetical protein
MTRGPPEVLVAVGVEFCRQQLAELFPSRPFVCSGCSIPGRCLRCMEERTVVFLQGRVKDQGWEGQSRQRARKGSVVDIHLLGPAMVAERHDWDLSGLTFAVMISRSRPDLVEVSGHVRAESSHIPIGQCLHSSSTVLCK